MALSLGRLTRRGAEAGSALAPPGAPDRPRGDLVWLHAPGAAGARGLVSLARSLSQDELCPVLLTSGLPLDLPVSLQDLDPPVIAQPAPPDRNPELRGFLAHWAPSAIILAEGEFPAALMAEAQAAGIPVMAVDASAPRIQGGFDWLPGALRRVLSPVRRIYALDEASARHYRRAVTVPVETGRLEEMTPLLPASEAEREAIARTLGPRPVWLALCPSPEEESAVLSAHRAALERSHRLLLILVCPDPAREEALTARMAEEQHWRIARRDLDEEPGPDCEVFLFASPEEAGLCLRLAPLCFLGGSLHGKGCQINPMAAAALGSAILHGPRVGAYGVEISRLGAARAAAAVANADQLADAVIELQAPDQAARLANAAWMAASDGAEVTGAVIAEIRRLLDGRPG